MPFEITVHDVGHCQAIHILTEMGTVIAIDLGCKHRSFTARTCEDAAGEAEPERREWLSNVFLKIVDDPTPDRREPAVPSLGR